MTIPEAPSAEANQSPGTPAARTARYYILGTCVTRDAFALDGAPAIAHYSARTSLASAFASEPTALPGLNLEGNPSAFQRRMVKEDVHKDLPRLLQAQQYDWLLVDLIDERFDLRLIGGGIITQSPELSLCLPRPEVQELIKTGSPEHRRRFEKGVDALVSIVPPEKIVLNRVYWSEADEEGVAFSDPRATEYNNALLARLYDMVKARGVSRELNYPSELLVASTHHRWGRSPFHFTDALYRSTLEQLAALNAAGELAA